MSKLNYIIGQRVFEFRQEREITQRELANEIGLSRTSVVLIEKGRQNITLQTLYKLCASFNVQPADILPKIEELTGDLGKLINILVENGVDRERATRFITNQFIESL